MSELTTADQNNNAVMFRAEIDIQLTTAKAYPRSIKKSLEEAKDIVTMSQKIAESCIYAVPRKKKNDKTGEYEEVLIEGPSIRMAEIMATSYGNIHCATRILENDGKTLTAQAAAWDLEKNFKLTEEVRRGITYGKNSKYKGQTLSDDMQVTIGNAARSVALRNAILKVIPRSFTEEVYDEAKKMIAGNDTTLPERLKKMIEAFDKLGKPIDKVLGYIKKKSIEEVTKDDMPILIGIFNAIKDNIFEEDEEKQATKTDKLNEELKGDAEAAEAVNS
jgi:tellurite resistance protein